MFWKDHELYFQQATYDSCKNVRSGNTKAINLICDSLECDLDYFYVSLGINKYTDLKVFYEIYSPDSKWNILSDLDDKIKYLHKYDK